jgi:hypothetical protein
MDETRMAKNILKYARRYRARYSVVGLGTMATSRKVTGSFLVVFIGFFN